METEQGKHTKMIFIYLTLLLIFSSCSKEIEHIKIKNPMVICVEIDTLTNETKGCGK